MVGRAGGGSKKQDIGCGELGQDHGCPAIATELRNGGLGIARLGMQLLTYAEAYWQEACQCRQLIYDQDAPAAVPVHVREGTGKHHCLPRNAHLQSRLFPCHLSWHSIHCLMIESLLMLDCNASITESAFSLHATWCMPADLVHCCAT